LGTFKSEYSLILAVYLVYIEGLMRSFNSTRQALGELPAILVTTRQLPAHERKGRGREVVECY